MAKHTFALIAIFICAVLLPGPATASPVPVGYTSTGKLAKATDGSALTLIKPAGIDPTLCPAGTVMLGGATVTCGAWIGSTYGSSVLAASPYNLAGANGVYSNIGLSAFLPIGVSSVDANLRTAINSTTTAGSYITCRLYNTTAGAVILDSERIGAVSPDVSKQYYGQISIHRTIPLLVASTIDVQCMRTVVSTVSLSAVYNDANGKSTLDFIPVSN